MKNSKQTAPHYFWGDKCEAWRLVDQAQLAVIEEKMPVGTRECLHLHENAQQYFYILEGLATFEIEGEMISVNPNEGIYISRKQKHFIKNEGTEALRFLVISQPNTKGDRKEFKTE